MWDLIVSVSDHCLSFYFRRGLKRIATSRYLKKIPTEQSGCWLKYPMDTKVYVNRINVQVTILGFNYLLAVTNN